MSKVISLGSSFGSVNNFGFGGGLSLLFKSFYFTDFILYHGIKVGELFLEHFKIVES